MRTLLHLLGFLVLCLPLCAESGLKRYLYMSTPDAAQLVPGAPKGILVFDIDEGHRFVRQMVHPVGYFKPVRQGHVA